MLLITDTARLLDPLPAVERLPKGAGVIVRHYDSPDRARLAAAVMAIARRRRLVVLVAGDWRLAASCGADGIHLSEGQAASGRLAALRGWARRRGRLVTVACHSPQALARARWLRADAALLSPVFATASHPGAAGIGAMRFARWCRAAGLPVVALGGVNRRTAPRLAASGAVGIAGIGGLVSR